jgi:isopenicillin-N epimerase
MLQLEVPDQPPPFGQSVRKELFLLDKEKTFANHGSFGTVPRSVLQVQRRLGDLRENDPESWYRVTALPLYLDACKAAAEFVSSSTDNVVIVDNATTAVNSVLKSLEFNKNDAILVTDHTYQAVDNTVSAVTLTTEARIVRHLIPFPVDSVDQFIASFKATLSANTDIRLAVIDHITSQSAVLLPVKKLTEICHSRNIQVLVDGAHALGQLPLDLEYLDPDYYTGNLHKWMYAPRGCCLLYINQRHQDKIHPLVTSWYWKKGLQEQFFMQGTRDILSWLCAKPAIQFYSWLGGLVCELHNPFNQCYNHNLE